MIHLTSALLLSFMLWAGQPAVTEESGENGRPASAELSAPQDGGMAAFAASLSKYYVGVGRRGPNWSDATKNDMDDVTKANRVYLADLVSAKKLVGAGRVLDGEDWGWLLFFKGDSLAQVKTLTTAAPAVSAGRFSPEFRRLWGTKGMGGQLPTNVNILDLQVQTNFS